MTEQLAEVLRKRIVGGVWKAGDVLPGIHELARMCNTSEKGSFAIDSKLGL